MVCVCVCGGVVVRLCVCVEGWWCVSVCVWRGGGASVCGGVVERLWVCVEGWWCVCVWRGGGGECVRVCRRLCECKGVVFQCVSVSLYFV